MHLNFELFKAIFVQCQGTQASSLECNKHTTSCGLRHTKGSVIVVNAPVVRMTRTSSAGIKR